MKRIPLSIRRAWISLLVALAALVVMGLLAISGLAGAQGAGDFTYVYGLGPARELPDGRLEILLSDGSTIRVHKGIDLRPPEDTALDHLGIDGPPAPDP